ncbi:MAG: Mut7-C RNAse domain-containing protein [Syntrophobacter sp.]
MNRGGTGAEPRFVVDVMLGKLAKWLRVLGFDARVAELRDPGQIESCRSQGFVPVTRREKFKGMENIVFISTDRHLEQIKELLTGLDLGEDSFRLFTRCTICNAQLHAISREAAFGSVPDYIFETTSDFRTCLKCGRVYWPGSHKGRMIERLKSITTWDPRHEEAKNG